MLFVLLVGAQSAQQRLLVVAGCAGNAADTEHDTAGVEAPALGGPFERPSESAAAIGWRRALSRR